jgi:hypothetical protein
MNQPGVLEMRRKRSFNSYKNSRKYSFPNPFFLIVCEGEVSEPEYFKSFPYYSKLGKTDEKGYNRSFGSVYIKGAAGQYKQLVINAKKIYNELKNEYGTIKPKDVWCVLDCDCNLKQLSEAIIDAKKEGFNVIYSIQCFELWYLLHFQMLSTAIRKNEYDNRLSKHLKIKYTHNLDDTYDRLLNYQNTAIKNAEKLWKQQKEAEGGSDPVMDPVTNVFMLVNALNEAYENIRNRKFRTYNGY